MGKGWGRHKGRVEAVWGPPGAGIFSCSTSHPTSLCLASLSPAAGPSTPVARASGFVNLSSYNSADMS